MDIEELFNTSSILDLSFFNFRNAVTAAYFADAEFRIKRVNKQFKTFFPILDSVEDAYFPDVLRQLGIDNSIVEKWLLDINSKGRVLIPEISISLGNVEKVYSLLSTRTNDQNFNALNGVQGQFVDRTEEAKLRRQAEILFKQQTNDKKLIEEKSRQLENLANQLSKYLSPQVYQNIFSDNEKLDTTIKRKNLTIFFSDIEKFTDLSDTLEPEQLASIINSYLSEMATIAIECKGTIDKFIGDAILVFFGDPESEGDQNNALNCLRMAKLMLERVSGLQEFWKKQGATRALRVRMGVATGFCTVGNFGSEQRLDYTVLGGPVNLAARLQSHASANTILIAETTYNLVKDSYICEEFDEITPKGFTRPIQTFKVNNLVSEEEAGGTKPITRAGKFFDVTIDKVSNIEEALGELKNLQEELESLSSDNSVVDRNLR